MSTPKSPKPSAKPKASELVPVDWNAIEPLFKAGIRSVASIGRQHGVSHTGINKHAEKMGWIRSLKPAVMSRVEQLVSTGQVSGKVSDKGSFDERAAVETTAQAIAMVQGSHQVIARELKTLAQAMLAELMASSLEPEVFVRVRDLLESIGDEPTTEQKAAMRDAMLSLANLPGRVKTLKDLVELMTKIVGMEREAWGLNTEDGTGKDRFTVIVKDYTGRGDPDSPKQQEEPAP